MKEKVILFWSGGKDSALALNRLRRDPSIEVMCLISTLNKKSNTINFHGIKDSLLIQQSNLIGIPLQRIYLNHEATNQEYIDTVTKFLKMYKKKGAQTVAFGDINLKDLRIFRDNFIHDLGLKTLYPLWEEKTEDLAAEFLNTSHRAIITSTLTSKLDFRFIGKEFNQEFLNELPSDVDPCGENGEFHTFVNFGPGFKSRVQFSKSMPIEEGPYYVSYLKDN